MLVTVEGIVIGSRVIGDNNCFIDILTDEYGIIEATAHGVKKLTSKNAGACSLFSYSKFCLAKKNGRYTLNSSEPKFSFYGISSDIEYLALAAYFSEVMKYTVSPEQEASGFRRFMAVTLFELDKKRIPIELIKAVFELRIASMLGFTPDLRACHECICYESEQMYFDFRSCCIFCGDCSSESTEISADIAELSGDMLYMMRYIVFSELDRIYRRYPEGLNIGALSEITEKYLLNSLDRGFRSLDYYKSVKLNVY